MRRDLHQSFIRQSSAMDGIGKLGPLPMMIGGGQPRSFLRERRAETKEKLRMRRLASLSLPADERGGVLDGHANPELCCWRRTTMGGRRRVGNNQQPFSCVVPPLVRIDLVSLLGVDAFCSMSSSTDRGCEDKQTSLPGRLMRAAAEIFSRWTDGGVCGSTLSPRDQASRNSNAISNDEYIPLEKTISSGIIIQGNKHFLFGETDVQDRYTAPSQKKKKKRIYTRRVHNADSWRSTYQVCPS